MEFLLLSRRHSFRAKRPQRRKARRNGCFRRLSPYQYDVTFHFRASGSLYKSLQSSLRVSNVTTAQCFFPSEELVTKQFSKMPASATPHDDSSKTTTVIIYLKGLSSKQQFISNLRQIKTTTQSALTRNTLSQKPRKAKPYKKIVQ